MFFLQTFWDTQTTLNIQAVFLETIIKLRTRKKKYNITRKYWSLKSQVHDVGTHSSQSSRSQVNKIEQREFPLQTLDSILSFNRPLEKSGCWKNRRLKFDILSNSLERLGPLEKP